MKRGSGFVVLAGLLALAAAAAAPKPAAANFIGLPPDPIFELDVTYTGGSIVSGPLSFGLGALPASVRASFVLGAGLLSSEPGAPVLRTFSFGDVISANLSFGDGTWTGSELSDFTGITNGVFTTLTYEFNGIVTPSVIDGVILNFPLSITGTDIASTLAFEYRYANSALTLTAIPEPASLTLFLVGLAGLRFMARRRRSGTGFRA